MKQRKCIVVLLLCAALVLSLCGCGTPAKEAGKNEVNSEAVQQAPAAPEASKTSSPKPESDPAPTAGTEDNQPVSKTPSLPSSPDVVPEGGESSTDIVVVDGGSEGDGSETDDVLGAEGSPVDIEDVPGSTDEIPVDVEDVPGSTDEIPVDVEDVPGGTDEVLIIDDGTSDENDNIAVEEESVIVGEDPVVDEIIIEGDSTEEVIVEEGAAEADPASDAFVEAGSVDDAAAEAAPVNDAVIEEVAVDGDVIAEEAP